MIKLYFNVQKMLLFLSNFLIYIMINNYNSILCETYRN
uniref:Uncharacterized protein n=1 Tax=Chondria sp. (in: red algae) TaxID=1982705 RepID=A0A1Z1MCX9_9FLOR|nr:hypothetical protein [Chondria sp. (in: red algae)]